MYKEDLALNNVQWLICHKTNQKIYSMVKLATPVKAHFKRNIKHVLALNNLQGWICH